jgi:hypothetical protein
LGINSNLVPYSAARRDGDRFAPVATTVAAHREGSAIEIELPVNAGWSVLRLTRGT